MEEMEEEKQTDYKNKNDKANNHTQFLNIFMERWFIECAYRGFVSD